MAGTRLTVLLGSGSTVAAGAPSTEDLTNHVCRLPAPLAVKMGIPFLLHAEGTERPLQTIYYIPVCRHIAEALKASYDSVNFELIIHALEQLQPFAQAQNADLRDNFRHVLSAFLQAVRKHEIVLDATLLREMRRAVIQAILERISDKLVNAEPKPEKALLQFFNKLSERFDLSVFTLNYDDLADQAATWFDGFTSPCDPNTTPTPHAFDRKEFVRRSQLEAKVLVHIHGSTRFGYYPGGTLTW
jgi:hypothetical protein